MQLFIWFIERISYKFTQVFFFLIVSETFIEVN